MRKVLSIRHTSSPFISGKKNDEFFASPAAQFGMLTQFPAHMLCDPYQYRISAVMSPVVIDPLKEINIAHTNGKRHSRLFPVLLRNILHHLTAVPQTCQRIGPCLFLQLLIIQHQLLLRRFHIGAEHTARYSHKHKRHNGIYDL